MTGLIIALVTAIVSLVVVVLLMTKEHRKETMDLHDRLASKSLEDYRYWRDRHPEELKDYRARLELNRREVEERLEKDRRKGPAEPGEAERIEAAKQF